MSKTATGGFVVAAQALAPGRTRDIVKLYGKFRGRAVLLTYASPLESEGEKSQSRQGYARKNQEGSTVVTAGGASSDLGAVPFGLAYRDVLGGELFTEFVGFLLPTSAAPGQYRMVFRETVNTLNAAVLVNFQVNGPGTAND